MVVLREIRRRARHVIPPVLGVCVVIYFVYHAIQGDRGLRAYASLTGEVEHASTILGALNSERYGLEKRVRLLRPDSLDLDLLEERARATLDVMHDDDVIILIKDQNFQ